MLRVLQHEGVRRAGVEPDVEMSSTFFQSSLARRPRKRSRAPAAYQASAPSCSKASAMRLLTASSCRISAEPSPFSRTNTAIGTPQARWREITQSGRLSIMPLMRFSPAAGTQRVVLIARSAMSRKRAVAGPVIGLSIAMNHCGVLRKITGFFERQECGYWCFSRPRAMILPASTSALMTASLASPFSPLSVMTRLPVEAGRLRGERAVLVDGVGDRRIDAARFERARIRGPDVEVLAAVARRGVHEAGAGVVGDVIAGEQRHVEVVAALAVAADARRRARASIAAGHVLHLLDSASTRACLNTSAASLSARINSVAGLRPVVGGRIGDAIEAVGDLRRIADRAVARHRPGRRRPDDDARAPAHQIERQRGGVLVGADSSAARVTGNFTHTVSLV